MTLSLSLAVEDYEWLEPMIDGAVTPDGIDLDVSTFTSGGERHTRMMNGEFDAAEFSLCRYVTGWPDWEFTAIPAFPRRFFPQSKMIVNADAGVDGPADLAGKRVAISTYQNTHALWSRGILTDRYDLALEDVEWYTTGDEPIPMELPVELGRVDRDRAPELVSRGELDALFLSKSAELYPLREHTRRLFPEVQTVERAYYEDTGYYPVMHNVVVQDAIVEDHPWVPTELLRLFRRSVARFQERARYEAKYPLVWWQQYREQEHEIFGDVWGRSFEFDANADELRTLIRYAHEQGLVDERYDPEELFLRPDEHLLSDGG